MNERKTNYRCVTNIDSVKAYLDGHSVVAFDYEVAPDEGFRNEAKSALDPAKSHICTMSISVEEGTSIMIPVKHKIGNNIPIGDFYAFLAEFLTDTKIVKIAHNLAYEAMFSYAKGIIVSPPVYDTLAASQLTLKSAFQFRKLADSGLKVLAKEVFNENLPSFLEVTEGNYFDEMDPNDQKTICYSCADADFALRLYNVFNCWFDGNLPQHRKIVEEIESPTAIFIGMMKFNGVPINKTLMSEKQYASEIAINKIKKEIRKIIGDVNIGKTGDTKEFKKYLFCDLKLPVLKRTDHGSPSMDDEALIKLKEWSIENAPELTNLFKLIQNLRKFTKIKSTYIDGYIKHINTATGKIHPDFFALSTDTGRFSCNSPNLQNMPRKSNDPIGIRNFIQAPEGCVIISLDFSQIELKVGAFYCRDEVMLDTYRTNGDIHAATTSVIFGVSQEDAKNKNLPDYKEQRTIAKNVNFGTFYGLFPKGLQQTLKYKAGINKDLSECQMILDNLKAGYKRLSLWQEQAKAEARIRHYSETWIGRRRYLPEITSDNWAKKSFAERCALNTPIQGTAADILKISIVNILKGISDRMWLKPILQIHDELVFIVPEDKLNESVLYIKECMEQKPFKDFDIPLVAEASVGLNFGEMEDMGEIDVYKNKKNLEMEVIK